MAQPRTVLLTGAAGGLGQATSRAFVAAGWRVFAADLVEPPAGAGLTPIQVDVTETASVDRALSVVEEQSPGGLDAVVTMAGVLAIGALAEMSDAEMERIVGVNVLGTHRIVRAAFPLLRRGQGRVVLISSETGWQPAMPLNGAYAMTKHAIEAYGDALRRELTYLDLPVTIVQPGPFRTAMTASIEEGFAATAPDGSPFAPLARRIGRLARGEHAKSHDPAVLGAAIVRVATASRPPARLSVRPGRQRALLAKLPLPVADALLKRTLGSRAKWT